MPGQDRHIIVGIHVNDRTQQVSDLQGVLTKYGGVIKTRLGLHEAQPEYSASTGIIILELLDNEQMRASLVDELNAIPGIETQQMVFDH